MTILIIDRSELVVSRLIELIAEQPLVFRFLSAGNAEQGLALALAEKPAMVLLDMQIPGNKVPELVRRLKEIQGIKKVILFYTYADEILQLRCREAGADYLLDKYNEFENIIPMLTGDPEKDPPSTILNKPE